jgi:hypothetical protein
MAYACECLQQHDAAARQAEGVSIVGLALRLSCRHRGAGLRRLRGITMHGYAATREAAMAAFAKSWRREVVVEAGILPS